MTMITSVSAPGRPLPRNRMARRGHFRGRRLCVALALACLAVAPGELGRLTRELVEDAYFQVSVFVAATLFLFYGSERLFRFNIGQTLQNSRGWQVPLAALLGATPGCGGAVVVVAAYTGGKVGFGAVVATLTATMGDAAFLLIATRPDAAAVVLPTSFAVGIVSGWLVDRLNRTEFRNVSASTREAVPRIGRIRVRDCAYALVAAPGLIIGGAQLGQVEITDVLGVPALWLALVGSFLGLAIWATSPLQAMTNHRDSPATRMAEETSFISVYVLGAYLAYDYLVVFAGFDLEAWFTAVAPLLPLIAIVVGFIPGCGPQVLVTTLYINGAVPFAALMGNTISNDGDALLPAIALTPRAAVIATAYSAIPALLAAYGFHFLAPGFLN
ncbi:MAG: arsenic efflux protein [Rhodobacter sp.]|nr:arsenic efflux protein [Rhodobacter sp.]